MLANTCFSESDKDKNYFGKVDVSRIREDLSGLDSRTIKMF